MYNDPDLPHVRGHEDDASLVDGGDVEATGATPRFGRLALCVAAASALALGVTGTVAYGVWFNSDQQTYAEAIARARQALRMPAPNNMAAALAKSSAPPDTPLATSAQAAPPSASVAPEPLMTSAIGAPAPKPGIVTGSPTDTVALLDLPALPAQSSMPAVVESRKPSVWSGQISRPQEEELLADNAAAAPSSAAPAAAVSPRSMQRTTSATEPAAPQLASTRPAREAKYAQQERRASATSARHKGNLFARMGSFFRRVSYRQHGSGSQQDIYSHP
ncbi:hypothetical protein [Paraburkholderia dilworthii]|uniref:hypothetical protein n=1 Tax=Paraburkholderia dilworthii TaxID=948106 RepID=UPI0004244A2E|nr:hypothetical protein [Paraburkholderia dilworthii]